MVRTFDNWIIEGHTPRQVGWDEWLAWSVANQGMDARRVAEATVGEAWVSTVFLTVDHQFGDGPPILFETMVFGGDHDGAAITMASSGAMPLGTRLRPGMRMWSPNSVLATSLALRDDASSPIPAFRAWNWRRRSDSNRRIRVLQPPVAVRETPFRSATACRCVTYRDPQSGDQTGTERMCE